MVIKRKLLSALKDHLSQKEITLILGPRQAGKTTLMLLLKAGLEKRGKKTAFFNLDIESDKQFFTDQSKLIEKIRLELGEEKGFVFIDEIQRKENAGIFLKGIYDLNLPYKLIVSGSGSLELKEKIHESLAGRKRIFKLNTLSFEEFVNFKTDYRYQKQLSSFFRIDSEKTIQLLVEYLNFGGYPQVVLEKRLEEKRKIINEIYQSYLERDIAYLLKVKKTEAFTNLVKLLASQAGQLTNFNKLSSILNLSLKTVKNYLWYLEKTFILHKITPYFSNIRKEICKSPIFYFTDLGLRNYSLGLFGNLVPSQNLGFLFQNLIFSLLKEQFRHQNRQIHFWRTKDGAEVDFVISLGTNLMPIEVKYQHLKNPTINRSLRSFIQKYQPEKALVVNLSFTHQLQIDKTTIHFSPFYQLASRLLPLAGGLPERS